MKLIDIKEVKVHRDDMAMDDMYDQKRADDRNTSEAPYYVAWSGQSYEWYGDGDPDEGQGRYKAKGDGGRIVAINIPTHEEANQVVQLLNRAYEENKFPDTFVYGRMGEDHYLVEYDGAQAQSMKTMGDWDKRNMEYSKPADYAKGQTFSL